MHFCVERVLHTHECQINEFNLRLVCTVGEANDTTVTYITGHQGFWGVCLNVWVLQAMYFQCRQEHGSSSSPSFNEYACNSLQYTLFALFHLSIAENTDTSFIGS